MLLKLLLAGLTAGPFCLVGLCSTASGQDQREVAGSANGSFAAPAPLAVRQYYRAASPIPAQLYNGPEYINYALRYAERKDHQFFLTTEPQPGSVFYNQQQFDNLQLQYDVVLDQVVVGLPDSPLQVRLVNEKLDRFTIGGRSFVRLMADSAAGNSLSTGFYEVLREGRVQILARRTKRKQERISGRAIMAEFIPTEKLFAHKNGVYYPLSSSSSVMKLFADRQAEVQAYMRQNRLKLRKSQFESVVGILADFYNQLPPR